jgi:hypothetical protein
MCVEYPLFFALLTAIILAGCSGGKGGTSALPPQSHNPLLLSQSLAKQTTSGNVTFAIR